MIIKGQPVTNAPFFAYIKSLDDDNLLQWQKEFEFEHLRVHTLRFLRCNKDKLNIKGIYSSNECEHLYCVAHPSDTEIDIIAACSSCIQTVREIRRNRMVKPVPLSEIRIRYIGEDASIAEVIDRFQLYKFLS